MLKAVRKLGGISPQAIACDILANVVDIAKQQVVRVGVEARVNRLETGTQKWHFPTGDRIDSSPAVTNGVIYVGSDDHYLYAIDAATGTQKWSFPTGDRVHSSPVIANGFVYIGSQDSNYVDSTLSSNDETQLRAH